MARKKALASWLVKPVEGYHRLAEENLRRVFEIILPEEREETFEDLEDIDYLGEIEDESENCTIRQSL
jgi:hypothetical protein